MGIDVFEFSGGYILVLVLNELFVSCVFIV